MDSDDSRREFLKKGTGATLGLIAAGAAADSHSADAAAPLQAAEPDPGKQPKHQGNKAFNEYSRYKPSFGGPPGSPNYLGKLTPGLRKAGLEPVPLTTPDLGKLPWKMVNGAKEFHLTCEAVRREFLPGYAMNVWGFNGSLPGPTIEAHQGDRVRFVVHNKLPEPTSMHWHGLELPVQEDGVPGLTQDLIPPGETYVYEYDLHQTGTFFYHSHVAMQEAMGMVGFFIIHPRVAYEPTVDRDFGLIFQNFFIAPNQSIADSMKMDWNWHTINGRSGPFTTPLVCRHGERVRVRLLNFSPMQHHPIHLHGHTFWLTGSEGGRIPTSAWIPRNNVVTAVAQAQDFEFIAFNPGDWIFHCHMVHHMMNHMVEQVGPRIRKDSKVDDYLRDLDARPRVKSSLDEPEFKTPGYPQKMQGMNMSPAAMKKINGRRETRGMRKKWHMGVHGLMTVLRVLPDDLYKKVMESDEQVAPGSVFEEIVRRGKKQRQSR